MSDLLNKKYHVELEVLTPLHIGAGSEKDWMKGADFVEEQNKVYVLNQKKLLQNISIEDLSGFLVRKDDQGLKRKISGKLDDVSDLIFDKPASADNDIKTFIKNGFNNKPIVPGSSVKGAIRSILLKEFLKGSQPNRINEHDYFGSSTVGDEFMRFIKISDADFNETKLVNTKIFNLFKEGNELKGGWKHLFRARGSEKATTNKFKSTGFNTLYEVIVPKQKGELTISLSDRGFDNLLKSNVRLHYTDERVKKEIVSEIKTLFRIINKHTKNYLEKQIAFFKKYSNNETNNIINNLETIKKQIPDDHSYCILKMSAGSGFHSITGDWQFDDYSINQIDSQKRNRGKLNGRSSAKSRKIAVDNGDFYMMGFVKLSVLTDELIAQREKERLEKIEKEHRKEAERIAREKAEQERKEAEKRAKEEVARKAEEERIAKEKAEQQERERILKEKEEGEKRRQEANKQKREIENKKILSEGLKAVENIDDFNQGKKIIENYYRVIEESIMDTAQINILKNFIKRCIEKSNKRWKKAGKQDWALVKKWLGPETARQWFDELIK